MTERNDTDKAYALLRAVEADLREFVVNGDRGRFDPVEYIEGVHEALTEALVLLGVEVNPDEEYEFEGLIEEYEKQQNAIALEDFDPLEKKRDPH